MEKQFAEYAQRGMEFLKAVAKNLETPDDIAYADRLTSAVFSVIREIITPQESLHLISHLPMYMKAVYVNGWKMRGDVTRIKTRDEFFELLREKYPRTTGRPLGDYQSIRKDVKAVLSTLRSYISEGDLRDIQGQLPKPLADLWETEPFEAENAK